MRIALIGYGKMGKAIEAIGTEDGHEVVVLKIDLDNANELAYENLKRCDVAIEFTTPDNAVNNIIQCFDAGVPVVCGTTGWLAKLEEVKQICKQKNGTFLTTSNFSIGVNIFFEINNYAATLMSPHKEYDVHIEETHHTQKKDSPSGTAITLAELILEKASTKNKWVNTAAGNDYDLEIISKRIDPAAGIHKVTYTSSVDDIEIIHTTHNRQGFAKGALLAAEFIKDKKGIYTMKDVLGF
ncbi:MAG: 4-hydroxy-tetrahydrodipicolinate reductase [Ginsengibacter sp.]